MRPSTVPGLAVEQRTRSASALLAGIAGALVAAEALARPGGAGLAVALVAVAALAALAAAAGRKAIAERVGPRHVLDLVLPFSALVVLVFAVWDTLSLPDALALVTHPLLAASLTVAVLATTRLDRGDGRRSGHQGWRVLALAFALGALAWSLLVPVAGLPAWLVSLVLLVGVLAVWGLVWPVEDPVHPGRHPASPYVPWGEVPGRPWPSAWHRVPVRAPATVGYLVASWALFLHLGDPGVRGWWGLDQARYEAFLFEIPDLSRAPLAAAASLVTSPFLNHDHIQLIYVTALLVLFGLPFEVREGTPRAVLVFAATGLAGALVAGLLLHGIHPLFQGHPVVDHAWERTWSGGSVGAFGLMGALAARARRWWPAFGFFVFWELNVGAWYLRSYTPAFHLTALVVGFLVARRWLAPRW